MSTPTPDYYLRKLLVTKEDLERGYVELDLYRVARLWSLEDPALFQAFKKTLCAGKRGGKPIQQDVKEAKDALERWLELEEPIPEVPLFRINREAMLLLRKVDERWQALYVKPGSKHRWDSVSWIPEDLQQECEPISEGEARALVEKAGGVW